MTWRYEVVWSFRGVWFSSGFTDRDLKECSRIETFFFFKSNHVRKACQHPCRPPGAVPALICEQMNLLRELREAVFIIFGSMAVKSWWWGLQGDVGKLEQALYKLSGFVVRIETLIAEADRTEPCVL